VERAGRLRVILELEPPRPARRGGPPVAAARAYRQSPVCAGCADVASVRGHPLSGRPWWPSAQLHRSTTGPLMQRPALLRCCSRLWRRAGGPRHPWLPGWRGSDHLETVGGTPICCNWAFCVRTPRGRVATPAGAPASRLAAGGLMGLACGLACSPPSWPFPAVSSGPERQPRGPLRRALPLWARVLEQAPTTLRPGATAASALALWPP